MVYDEALAARVRTALAEQPHVDEKKMFGGITFMVEGQMCCGVLKQDLVVKLGAEGWDEVIAQPHVRPFDFTGKPMVGMVYVSPAGLQDDSALEEWVQRGLAFVAQHPKQPRSGAKRRA